ncbi:MAG: hypothetical protein R3B13_06955 [Polyangiaceae bacterium]
MKRHLILLTTALLAATQIGCEVACIEDGSGTRCTAKSLNRYDGVPPAPQAFTPAAGAPISVDVLYGNVYVTRSTTPQVVVEFKPFAYAAYDNKATADRELAENLRVSAVQQGGIQVSVAREGGSNGLGADVILRVPDSFDGALEITNRAGGPVNHFDIKADFVGRARALTVRNSASLGQCYVQGAATVQTTNVQCNNAISVFDVSGTVNITNDKRDHEGGTPAVTLRMAAVGGGGRILTASGSINATFPASGGYALTARAASRGQVQEGALPANCTKQERGPGDKIITCGNGPHYELTAGHAPTGAPRDANVVLSYR